MAIFEVKTQAEFEAAYKKATAADEVWLRGNGEFTVHASGSAIVRASNSATVHASDSATVHASNSATVHASDSATVHAWGSATVRASNSATVHASDSATVHAWGSATVHASDSATVHASDSATVHATGNVMLRVLSDRVKFEAKASVAVMLHENAKGKGGNVMKAMKPKTAAEWCDLHGVEVSKGVAVVFKAVGDNFRSLRGGDYTPGTIPVAPDWDGGRAECGGGLHFSPTPTMALQFAPEASKFVACKVRLKDMRAPKANDDYPQKIKAKGCCAPTWEVDINGKAREGETTKP